MNGLPLTNFGIWYHDIQLLAPTVLAISQASQWDLQSGGLCGVHFNSNSGESQLDAYLGNRIMVDYFLPQRWGSGRLFKLDIRRPEDLAQIPLWVKRYVERGNVETPEQTLKWVKDHRMWLAMLCVINAHFPDWGLSHSEHWAELVTPEKNRPWFIRLEKGHNEGHMTLFYLFYKLPKRMGWRDFSHPSQMDRWIREVL